MSDIEVFIIMKSKKLTIRITESQFKRLSDKIIEEQTDKSKFVRNLIDKIDLVCREDVVDEIPKIKSRIQLLDIIKRKKS